MFTAAALKMPVSSTHSIIGALMGFQMVIDPSAPNWEVLGQICISWIATPMISFVAAALFMLLCDRWWPLFLIDDDSLSNYQQLTDEPIVPEAVPMKAVNPKKNEEGASISSWTVSRCTVRRQVIPGINSFDFRNSSHFSHGRQNCQRGQNLNRI